VTESRGDRIAVKLSTARWVVTFAKWTCWLLVILALARIAYVAVGDSAAVRLVVALAISVVSVAFATRSGVKVYREAFWLNGTVLVQRGVWRDRRYNLATSAVTVNHARSPWSQRGEILTVTGNGSPVTLRLRADRLMPREQLHALANAIIYNRPHDEQAYSLPPQLRRLADNPFKLDQHAP
jgi:hypothetical protein